MSLHSFYKSSPRLRRLWRLVKNDVTYGLTLFALTVLRLLPFGLAMRLSEAVGRLVYLLLPSLRELPREHLRVALGDETTADERDRIARESVVNVARIFCEVAKFDYIETRLEDYIRFDDQELMDSILRRGRGAIVVTGHIGNWELLAAYFARKGVPISAVARRIYDDRINALLVDFRSRHGVSTILREDPSSARQIIRAVKRHEILAMVVDQDTKAPSISVPFFGRPARTPVAPATLALRRDIPIVAAFIERRREGGQRIRLQMPFSLPHSGDRMKDIREITAAVNEALETQIRRRPEEWVWWHKRWRSSPVPHLDLDAKLQ